MYYTDKQKTGTFTYYYLNGKPSSILNYKNGKKYGIVKWYTISGKLYKTLNYLMGDLEGDEELYNLESSIASEQQKSETITDL
jgi:antitoxin component YwqK of YwqJK toxin-antitoxin module